MKTHPARTSYAFTLIELITVIAIISVLMALLFPHLAAARENARRQEAATVIKSAVNACNNYKQDYGKYPPIKEAEDGSPPTNGFYSYGDKKAGKCKMDNNHLFDVLRAIDRQSGENEGHKMNIRQVKYYEGKKATDPKLPRDGFVDGTEFDKEKAGQLMDPWGAQYCILLDFDGDDVIDASAIYSDLSNKENFLRYSAVGFSMGKDSERGGKGYEGKYKKEKSNEAPDDVVSWQ
jgi:prepilin-type N-terminal cleavage/methylation domain-containing protein